MPVETAAAPVRMQLAATLRMFAEWDFDEAAAGHLTARDPEHPGWVLMNPIGVPFDELTASALSRVCLDDGDVVGEPVDLGGFRLHAAIYAARPDVGSVMHAHPVHTKAWSALVRPIDPITQESCIFYERHAVMPDYQGVFGATDEAARVASLLGDEHVAVVLAHHAAVVVGGSVGEAAYRSFILDRCCRVQLLAEAAGRPRLITPDVARPLARDTTHCEHSFGPLYRSIVRRHPEIAR